jgi:DNA uptake protein ComE-like DNA-binding protein
MKPVLLLLCVLLLISAAMLHSAIARENWPVTVIYHYPPVQDTGDAHPTEPDFVPHESETTPPPEFPLDLNRATREELMHVPGIGEVLSGRYRDYIGGYTDISELTQIYGISQNTLERISEYLTIEEGGNYFDPVG